MKQQITLDFIKNDAPNIILFAAPIMIILAFSEMYLSFKKKNDFYDKKDFFASLSIGLVYMVQSLVTKSIMLLTALWVYNVVPWFIPVTWYTSILCFVVLDLCRYLAHRYAHEINLFWATHVTHHNSEKYNLSTSFRLSWTQQIKIIFFLPISFFGFHPLVFFICHQIAVLYQFWIHTEYINKMPKIIELFFVTPSHHRVHHGKDDKYLDKNYGSTLIIWDKLFGTFQPEEERPTYGIINQPKGYNPVNLVFHVWVSIFKEMKKQKSVKDAIKVLVSPPSSLKE